MSDIEPYPKLLRLQEYDGMAGINAHIVADYGTTGLCCKIDRTESTRIAIGNWDGLAWSPGQPLMDSFIRLQLPHLLELTACLKLANGTFYFATTRGEFMLVDIMLSACKFASPGMLEELFSKAFRTQDTLDKITLTPELLDSIRNGVGRYSGGLIIKPNRYRTVHVDNRIVPLYIRVTR